MEALSAAVERSDGDPVRCLWQEFAVPYRFPVYFTRNSFSPENAALAEAAGSAEGPTAVFPIVDAGVAAVWPDLGERIGMYARSHPHALALAAGLHIFPGGERCKDGEAQVGQLHRLFLKHGLCRHSVVLAIGGGAFLDVAGYAASTAHRGIRLVRMPTTTLSQNDAGVGVKNGYNAFGRKNWVGSFSPPFAVVNDFDFLRTLAPRQRRAGIAEAIKVAVIKDTGFFRFLSAERNALARFSSPQAEEMIVRCARLHMDHIAAGDPFETGCARPLDFGHWAAHALEETSGDILHGEGVAIGIALDTRYAWETGLVSEAEGEAILHLLQDIGFQLSYPALAQIDLCRSLDSFRQHLGGRLTITLPNGIGSSIDVNSMDLPLLHRCREWLMSLPAAE
ncbi:3-dehydroquinate synthase [Geobacter sp. DSM 9736]|uniref:3-dehydroquinate synthase n=1 Tax=Geobacter sp. DSM 9736 TaxID=1277350 RepID=UPI000B503334|nr:3-dehydroquinate synthase [Geobacter sp. DSM 9736]SNB44675.1 3-dehydroquinate synthase [Geobacter sp. DSM 9736]